MKLFLHQVLLSLMFGQLQKVSEEHMETADELEEEDEELNKEDKALKKIFKKGY